jgi:hypothetical protein
MHRRLLLVYLGLLANVLVFFYKPLFDDTYIFPWDFRYVQLPLISFLADELQRGKLPLWDPFTYCGDPIFANIQACFFHPLVLAAAFVSAHTSLDVLPMLLEWVVALQIVFAGVVSFHLFRDLGAGTPSAFAGALIFETGGFFAAQAEHIGAIMAVAWMPLAWLAVLRLGRGFKAGWLAALAVAFGMSILGGLPQATVAVFASAAVLAILLVVHKSAQFRLIALTLAGCLIGLGLAAIQFIPTSQVTGCSVAKYRADWLGTGGGLHWGSFVSLVYPNYYHLFDLSKFKGPGDPTFLYLYGSLAGLGLVSYCLYASSAAFFSGRWRDPSISILAILLFFGAFWMLGDKTFLWRLLFPLLPVSVRIGIHPEFTFCIFTLAFAGLAALGLERLPVKALFRWAIALVIAVDLFLTGSGRPMNCASVLEEPGVTREAFGGDGELLQTLRGLVNRDSPPARIDTMDASINWAECATLTRVPAANGSSPLGLENIVRLQMLALAHPGVRWGWYYQVENPDAPVLDILNVKYLLAGPKGAAMLRTRTRYRQVASLSGYELFENLSVLPRYFLVNDVRQTKDREMDGLIQNHSVDLHRTALTEDAVTLPAPSPNPSGDASATVHTLRYEPDNLELEITSPQTSFLVLSEAFYPGWQASIDGRSARLYRTDIAFRGMVVPGGTHRIRMEFHPQIFDLARVVSGASALLLMALLLWTMRFRRPAFRP